MSGYSADCDAHLEIIARGQAFGAYYNGLEGKRYTKAKLSGQFLLKMDDNLITKKNFATPPQTYLTLTKTKYGKQYKSPSDAPFLKAFEKSSFLPLLKQELCDFFGPPVIRAVLYSSLPSIRWEVKNFLIKNNVQKDPSYIPVLITKVQLKYRYIRQTIIEMGTKAINPLADAIERNIFSAYSSSLLFSIDEKLALNELIKRFQHSESMTARENIALYFGSLKYPAAVELLLTTFQHKNESSYSRLVSNSIFALGQIADSRALEPLRKISKQKQYKRVAKQAIKDIKGR